MEDNNNLSLPPGFRFHPTDKEIITCYLAEKVGDEGFCAIAVGEADLNKWEPWDLPSKAKYGEKEWYFFYQKERRYPTGTRANRATKSGYWKATGKDKEIRERNGTLIGMKKTLVFYKGRAPKGEKTNWVMHEFRLEGDYPSYRNVPNAQKNGWVVVKVFHKEEGHKTNPFVEQFTTMEDEGDENCTQNYQVNESNSTSFLGQYCKVEQFSNSKVSTSKDTDDVSWYDDGDPSSGPLFDWENIWNY